MNEGRLHSKGLFRGAAICQKFQAEPDCFFPPGLDIYRLGQTGGKHPEPNEASKDFTIMNQTMRKITGTFLILLLMALYAILATTFAAANLAQSSGWVHLVYFFLTGLLWILPAMFIIKWMLKPDQK